MRKLWLFPLILFILLLCAGGWRWEKGPYQEQGDFQVLHTRDRWTGQRWLVVYGGFKEILPPADGWPDPQYSGDWIPHLTKAEFEERMEQLLAQPEHKSRWEGFQGRLRELEEVKSANLAGYERYLAIMENDSKAAAAEEAVFHAYQAWIQADQEHEQTSWELTAFYAELREKLVAAYKTSALQRKQIATYVWFLLLLTTFIFSLHYFILEIKRWQRVNETYEIVEYVTRNNRYPTSR